MFKFILNLFDKSHKIANDPHVIGKGGLTTCVSFAREIQHRLNEAKIKNHFVEFGWTMGRATGKHAFIIYFDLSGDMYAIDSLMSKSKQVFGKTDREIAQNAFPEYIINYVQIYS